jgi:hypothetical protein
MLIIPALDARFCCLSRSSHSKKGARSGHRNKPEDEEAEEANEGKKGRLRQEESQEGEEEIGLRCQLAGLRIPHNNHLRNQPGRFGDVRSTINLGCCLFFPNLPR